MKNSTSDRRRFLGYFSSIGLGASLLPGVLWANLQNEKKRRIDVSMLEGAESLAGIEFTKEERELMVEDLNRHLDEYTKVRAVALDNSVPPAIQFSPLLPDSKRLTAEPEKPFRYTEETVGEIPSDLEKIAFWPVTRLAAAIRAKKVTSAALTEMYLARLERFDPTLRCVITLTKDLARAQAKRADAEIRAGKHRGPLHGIPWGAKDLLSTKKYRTTWGAKPFENQVIDEDATVVERLDAAGAVLVAKLTLGALAWGDVWYGGKTRNPWLTSQGSSGSSAGPASATAAGLVGFSIGSETYGSIVSPSTRCGVTGLRPTFGRISRHGAMALSWSMDKLGPMCRSVEDTALVLDAIHGSDGKDPTAVDASFSWDPKIDVRKLRVGVAKSLFPKRRDGVFSADHETVDKLRELGAQLVDVEIPNDLPIGSLSFMLGVEAAAAFDNLTRSGRDDELVRQVRMAWPNTFRHSRLVPAVEYVQANRVRTLAMRQMAKLFESIDAYVAPSFGGRHLLLTNLTGHPALCLPNASLPSGTPKSITFVGNLYGEAKLLAIAKAYQDATDFHTRQPEISQE